MVSRGFLRFERNAHKPFFICGYSFQNASGIPKGQRFLWLWVSNRGESTLLAGESKGDRVPLAVVSKGGAALAGRIQWNRRFRGTRLCSQSLVCYTFGDRGWRKGVVRGGNKHFPSATEQADSASYRTRNPGVCFSRIRLFGCRWCGEMERQSAAEPWNGAASPGEPKGYQALVPPQRRILRHFGNAIVFRFGRSFRSELRISSMALFAYL